MSVEYKGWLIFVVLDNAGVVTKTLGATKGIYGSNDKPLLEERIHVMPNEESSNGAARAITAMKKSIDGVESEGFEVFLARKSQPPQEPVADA